MDYSELNQEKRQNSLLHSIVYWIVDICAVVALATFVVLFFCGRVTVQGHSMEPSLEDGDVVLVNRGVYHFDDPERFDVIVFERENNGVTKTYIKRIIGLPGETVQILNDTIYINGRALAAPDDLSYVSLSGLAEEPIQLDTDEYFVLGDNRESSEDSRFANIGSVMRDEIAGKVWFRIVPFADLGPVK